MTLRKALALGLGCALVDLLGAQLLDSIGFIEGLLAPNGAHMRLLVPLSCAFYGARLVTYFVLPALVAASLAFARRRPRPIRAIRALEVTQKAFR